MTTTLTPLAPQASAPDRQAALGALQTEIAAAYRRVAAITQALPDAPDSEQVALRSERTALYAELPGLLDDLEEAARRYALADLEAMAEARKAALNRLPELEAARTPLRDRREELDRKQRAQEQAKMRRDISEADYQTWYREVWRPEVGPVLEDLAALAGQMRAAEQAATTPEIQAQTRYQAKLIASQDWPERARVFARAVRAHAQGGR